MKKIPIKVLKTERFVFALVDDDDFERVSKWSWHLSSNGYAVRTGHKYVKGVRRCFHVSIHRTVMDAKKGQIVDHINRNKLDCRKNNLRFCSQSENNLNSPTRRDNSSGTRGVRWKSAGRGKKRWLAEIGWMGKTVTIGRFYTKRDAMVARRQAEKKFYPAICE